MKKLFLRVSLTFCLVCILFLWGISIAHAETRILESLITSDTTWTKTASPYVIDGDVTVADGATLTIGAGVEISPVHSEEFIPGIFVSNSRLIIAGAPDNPVQIHGLGSISVSNGMADISFTGMTGGEGFSFEGSRVRISTSSIKGVRQAIRSKDSEVTISDSRIENNTRAIRVEPHEVFQVYSGSHFGVGGIGNAYSAIPVASSSLSVSNSVIVGNSRTAVENYSDYSVNAPGNWWGSVGGPAQSGANRVVGSIEYDPWLMTEPDLTPKLVEDTCCSNVLFIPGLQATRLHDNTEQLWEPHNNMDVTKLFLDAHGSSTDPSIHPGSAIDVAYGVKSIYGPFFETLSSLKSEEKIADWSVFGYDWRKSIPEVVAGNNGQSLVETVEQLASTSRTGKVNIVAHSNGGLVTKYLLKVLTDLGKDSLVDKVVSVAVPYMGTPQAVSGLLHGDGQELGFGILLNSAIARELGSNMASAYSLLPSAEYFQHVLSPTVAFASTTVRGLNQSQYPQSIVSALDQKSFIIDSLKARATSTSADIHTPLKGNGLLMNAADILHSIIDPYQWPENIARYAIVGWNRVTTRGVEYKNGRVCHREGSSRVCGEGVKHTELTTKLGDGTVVAPSAAFGSEHIISLDLKKEADIYGDNYSHADILVASSTRDVVKQILSGFQEPVLPESASRGEPQYSSSNSLIVSTHSPVELHIYDSEGNHTGVTDAQLPGVEEGLYTHYEAHIPGSDFKISGDQDDPEAYIYLLETVGEEYSIVVKGTDIGPVTLRVERVNDEETLDSVEYEMFATPLSVASTSITLTDDSAQRPITSSTLPVGIDIDGNISRDATIHGGLVFDPVQSIQLIRTMVRTTLGTSDKANILDKRLSHLETSIEKGKVGKVEQMSTKLVKRVGHMDPQKLSQVDKDYVIGLIESFIAQFE